MVKKIKKKKETKNSVQKVLNSESWVRVKVQIWQRKKKVRIRSGAVSEPQRHHLTWFRKAAPAASLLKGSGVGVPGEAACHLPRVRPPALLASWRPCFPLGAPLGAQMVKNLPAMQETQVRSLGQEDPLGKETTAHSSALAWRISSTEKPGGLQYIGLQRVRHD